MTTTISWSYNLLPLLLARLTVFAAPFSEDSAGAVSGQDAIGAAENLALLLDHNMLSPPKGQTGNARSGYST